MGWKAYQTAKIQAWIERTKGGQNPLFRAKDIKPEDYFPALHPGTNRASEPTENIPPKKRRLTS
jgi:hypothetical protein